MVHVPITCQRTIVSEREVAAIVGYAWDYTCAALMGASDLAPLAPPATGRDRLAPILVDRQSAL
eukprot:3133310-Lingulodinium_polyedra.AAC.1